MYKNMSETILLEQRSCFMQAKRKSLILVKRRIKFTKFSHYVTNPYRRHQLKYLYFVFFISDVAVFQVSKTKKNLNT